MAAAGLVLSGCAAAGGQDEPEFSGAREKGPELFGVPASRLPFGPGPWDMEAPDFDQFNPCTEIPPEAYRAAGLPLTNTDRAEFVGYVASCESVPEDRALGKYVISSSLRTSEEMEDQGILVTRRAPEGPFSVHQTEWKMWWEECASVVYTDRGKWEVISKSIPGDKSIEDTCQRVEQRHKKLTETMGDLGNDKA